MYRNINNTQKVATILIILLLGLLVANIYYSNSNKLLLPNAISSKAIDSPIITQGKRKTDVNLMNDNNKMGQNEHLREDNFNFLDFIMTMSTLTVDEASVENLKREMKKTFTKNSILYSTFEHFTLYEIYELLTSGDILAIPEIKNVINLLIQSSGDSTNESINYKLAYLLIHFISVTCDEVRQLQSSQVLEENLL